MTLGYDCEQVVIALERLEAAAKAFYRHSLPEWLVLRLAHIRAEAYSLRVEIEKTKGSEDGRSILDAEGHGRGHV